MQIQFPEIISVTGSVGGTLARKDDSMDTVIKRADHLMFKSRVNGRNCISIDMLEKANISG